MKKYDILGIRFLCFLLLVAFLPLRTINAQAGYSDSITQATSDILTFFTSHGQVAVTQLNGDIAALNSLNGGLTDFQMWHKKYILGYLYFCSGIKNYQSNNVDSCGNHLGDAARLFENVYQTYDPAFNNSEKRDFSRYMSAYSLIRKFFVETTTQRTDIDTALQRLQGMNGALQGFAGEKAFLQGYAHLMRAFYLYQSSLSSGNFDGQLLHDLQSSLALFQQSSNTDHLNRLSRYFIACGHYFKFQSACLAKIIGSPDFFGSAAPADFMAEVSDLDADTTLLQNLFNDYNNVPNAQTAISYLLDLISLHKYAQTIRDRITSVLDQPESFVVPPAPVLITTDGYLLSIRNFLSGQIQGNPPVNTEAIFWQNLAKGFLEFKRTLPSQYFGAPPAAGSPSFTTAIPGLTAREHLLEQERQYWAALNSVFSFQNPVVPAEEAFNRHNEMTALLNIISSFFNYVNGVVPAPGATILPVDAVLLTQSPAIPPDPLQAMRSAQLAVVLAGLQGNPNIQYRLYAVAYVILLKLENAAGIGADLRNKSSLLRSFCLYKSIDPAGGGIGNTVSNRIYNTILSNERIAAWNSIYQTEAKFFRSYISRFLHGALDANAGNDMVSIANSEPRSGYLLAIEGADDIFLSTAACLVEESYNSPMAFKWFYEGLHADGNIPSGIHCNACQTIEPEFRYFAYEPRALINQFPVEYNRMRRYVLDEQSYMTFLWQVLSKPPQIPLPWVTNQDDSGAMEVRYLQDQIPVDFVLDTGGPGLWNVKVLTADTISVADTTYENSDGSFQLTTGVRYQFIFSAQGYWPVFVDTMFAQPGVLEVSFSPITKMAPEFVDEKSERFLSLYHGQKDVRLVSRGSYEIRDESGSLDTQQEGKLWKSPDKYMSDIQIGNGAFKRIVRKNPSTNGSQLLIGLNGNTNLHNLIGMPQATADGLRSINRIAYFPELSSLAVYDFFSNKLYLFLPNGEYITDLVIPPKLSDRIIYDFKVQNLTSKSMEIVFYSLSANDRNSSTAWSTIIRYQPDSTYNLVFSNGYESSQHLVVATLGGWFSYR